MSPSTVVATALMSRKAAVVGGSLGGLAASHALEQSGIFDQVDVFERSPTPMHEKGSGLGFCHVPAWEDLCQRPLLRRNQRANRAQGSFFYGDLWGFLYNSLLDRPNKKTTVHFGKTVQKIEGSSKRPVIDGNQYDLVVVADGGWSNLRKYVLDERAFQTTETEPSCISEDSPQYAGYVVWRGSVPLDKLSSKLVQDIQYLEGVYKSGIYDLIVLKWPRILARICGQWVLLSPRLKEKSQNIGIKREMEHRGMEHRPPPPLTISFHGGSKHTWQPILDTYLDWCN